MRITWILPSGTPVTSLFACRAGRIRTADLLTPLGAGGWFVRLNGRIYEGILAPLNPHRRRKQPLQRAFRNWQIPPRKWRVLPLVSPHQRCSVDPRSHSGSLVAKRMEKLPTSRDQLPAAAASGVGALRRASDGMTSKSRGTSPGRERK